MSPELTYHLLSATQAANVAGVKVNTFCNWVARGKITPERYEMRRGRVVGLYDPIKVMDVEASTRPIAERARDWRKAIV